MKQSNTKLYLIIKDKNDILMLLLDKKIKLQA